MRGRILSSMALIAALGVGGVQCFSRSGEAKEDEADLRVVIQTLAQYREDRDFREVVRVARDVLPTSELSYMLLLPLLLEGADSRGEGLLQLSYMALSDGHSVRARMYAVEAANAFASAGNMTQWAYALTRQSQADWKEGQLSDALNRADQALSILNGVDGRASRSNGYQRCWSRAHIARIDALRRLGDTDEVTNTFAMARQRSLGEDNDEWLLLKEGMHLEEQGYDGEARRLFLSIRPSSKAVKLQVLSNLAYLTRENYEQAMELARDTEELNGRSAADLEVVRARIEAHHQQWNEAWKHLEATTLFRVSDVDWKWEIARSRAEVLEANWSGRDVAKAEDYYRCSIEEVEALREKSRTHCAYLTESHRAPYEGLISLLSAQGRWREAVEAVLRLDSSDMLRVAAGRAQSVPINADLDAMFRGAAPHDVIILMARRSRELGGAKAEDLAYRIRIHNGEITGEAIGIAKDVSKLARDFAKTPSDRSLAQQLGKLLVPQDHETSTLQVLTFGALNDVPINALRGEDGKLTTTRRPLIRILALRTSTPAAPAGVGSLILANSKGDLPDATVEGSTAVTKIAAMLPQQEVRLAGHGLSLAATSELLLSMKQLAVLHVAGHADYQGGWRTLRLADANVGPVELLQHGVAPHLALLAACGSLVAKDGGGWGSIVAALIEAGTWRVLATGQDISSKISRRLMQEFYEQPDWYPDPERALGRAQLALDLQGVKAEQWAPFVMVGRPPFVVPADESSDSIKVAAAAGNCVR